MRSHRPHRSHGPRGPRRPARPRRPLALAAGLVGAALVLAAAPPPARACGPDFPIELLGQRPTTIAELEDGVFLELAGALVPAPTARYRVVDDRGEVDPAGESAIERALYATGAEAFHAGDHAAAERAFTQLLALPPALRRHRSTWAAYSLGRLRAGADAIAAYRHVRELVAAGFLDEGGLAASSLGQEARLHDDLVVTVRLYAEQAAHGHAAGATSLLLVARDAVEREAEGALVADPVGRRLLATYLRARGGELTAAQRARLWAALLGPAPDPAPAGADLPAAGADLLAAAAYRDGDLALARRLARRADDTRLARRVRAKLAVVDGDRAAAAALLASIDDGGDGGDAPRVCGERAILAARDDRFVEAMAHAWAMRAHHPDVLYLAERVLTIDELIAFVAALPPADPGRDGRWRVDPMTLRQLLGRRLLRAGRADEAIPYLAPPHRRAAVAYAGALARGRRAADPLDRAEGLYEASLLARRHGLELLGTAHAPDWEHHDARYDVGAYLPAEDPGPWRTPAEVARVAASAPAWSGRYHYRHVASALAEEAADLLPTTSQAFAATLCWSARHVRYVDEDRVEALWDRYIDEGPAVDFAPSFGHECPAPDFARLRAARPRPPAPAWQLVLVVLLAGAAATALARHLRPPRGAARP